MARWSRPFKREHLGVTTRRNRASLTALISSPEQRERFEADFPESTLPALPRKRTRRDSVDIDAVHRKLQGSDLEGPVVAAVSALLATHPRVLLAVRQNSGSLPYDSNGRAVPVHFYKLLRVPEELTIVDHWGFLRDGKPYAFECKRPSWRGLSPTDKREQKQAAFLRLIECIGGVSRFVTDVRQVDEALA